MEAPDPVPAPRVLRGAAQALLGLVLGLGLTEAAFRHRDGNAFPLVNVYEPDALRGVRLSPGGGTVIGSPGQRTTRVRVNREGYRGPDWPVPAAGEVVVVGDSLSFGLGVDEEEALAARLHAALPGGPAVLDASVPTYGPPEYLTTLEEVLARRKPAAAVLVVNLLNDMAEIDRPNTGRHAAVDGWAVRIDAGAGASRSSPLRTWAIQRSHAAFALWRWDRTRSLEEASLPPEPGFEAMIQLGARAAVTAAGLREHERAEAVRAATVAAARAELEAAKREVVALARHHRSLAAYVAPLHMEWGDYLRADGEASEDVFVVWTGGCAPAVGLDGRLVDYNRRLRFPGERIRRDVEDVLRDYARVADRRVGDEIRAAFARREAAEAAFAAAPSAPLSPPPAAEPLPIQPFLAGAAEIAARHGTPLWVVVAPIDAQASTEAQRRRGLSDGEVSALDALSAEIASAAGKVGAVGIDATPALKAAGDAGFLPDGHLSPAGHEAVARRVGGAMSGQGAR